MEENPDLVLTLKSITQRASDAFMLPHNRDRYVPPSASVAAEDTWSRQTTPATNGEDEERREEKDFSHGIQLKLNDGHKLAWSGGSSRSCEVLLGRGHISNRHFCIRFDDQERPILEAWSKTHAMIVSYDGRGEEQPRKHYFRWILFPWAEIKVTLDRDPKKGRDELQFGIELAKHSSCQKEYEERVQSFLEKSRNEESRNAIEFSHLNMDSQKTTAPPTRPVSPRPISDLEDEEARQYAIYLPVEELGRGTFAIVHKVIDVSTGNTYAGKYFFKSKLDDRQVREIEIMRKYLRDPHDHIIRFVDFTDEVGPLLVMECFGDGNLRYQHQNNPFTYTECVMILHQGLLGLEYLHNLRPNWIVHRDIKPDNILVSRYPLRMKYADFGVATDSADLQTECGTEVYAAPEIWTSSNQSPTVDIWSLGLVVYELASGLPKQQGKFNYVEWFEQLTQVFCDCHPNDLINFLKTNMLQIDPDGRLPAGECLDAAPELFQAMLPMSDDETEVMTPTEKPLTPAPETRRDHYHTEDLEESQELRTQMRIPQNDSDLPLTARSGNPGEEASEAQEAKCVLPGPARTRRQLKHSTKEGRTPPFQPKRASEKQTDHQILTEVRQRRRPNQDDQRTLEAEYKRNRNPSQAERMEILKKVSLNDKDVQKWFQNRRQHTRRQSRSLLPHELALYVQAPPRGPITGMNVQYTGTQNLPEPRGYLLNQGNAPTRLIASAMSQNDATEASDISNKSSFDTRSIQSNSPGYDLETVTFPTFLHTDKWLEEYI